MKTFEYQFTVLEKHLDTFGHVNNATYFSLFEEARWDFITKNGYGMREVQKLKQGPVILEAHIKFKKELHLREAITIISQGENTRHKIMKIHQKMLRANGEECCVVDYVIGFFDLKERKLIEPTPAWLKAIGVDQN